MMKRRDFIHAAGIAAGAMPVIGFAANTRPRIGVIGGGIIGASIATYLAEAGADVVVFEKQEPASGATKASLAWINPSTVNTHYRDLRLQSMQEWKALDARLGLGVIWGGSVSWTDNDEKAKDLDKREDALQNTGAQPKHLTESDITKLCPYLAPGETKAGFYLPHDGHIDPVAVTNKILAHAKRKGVKLVYPCAVEQIVVEGSRVKGVKTTKGAYALDYVVSACGVDTPGMLAKVGLDIKMRTAPGLKIHTKPIAPATKMVYDFSSALEFKQMPNGEAVAIYVGGPPKTQVHEPVYAGALKSHPTAELATMHGQSLKLKVAKYWPALRDADIKSVIVGFRPMPMDGLPMIGNVPGVDGMYVVATHSGITLAPIIGKYAAQEIVSKASIEILGKYRPNRFV